VANERLEARNERPSSSPILPVRRPSLDRNRCHWCGGGTPLVGIDSSVAPADVPDGDRVVIAWARDLRRRRTDVLLAPPMDGLRCFGCLP
jgi:hypothetical protein